MFKSLLSALLAGLSGLIVTCLYPEQVKEAVELIAKPFSSEAGMISQNYREFIDDVMMPCHRDIDINLLGSLNREPDLCLIFSDPLFSFSKGRQRLDDVHHTGALSVQELCEG